MTALPSKLVPIFLGMLKEYRGLSLIQALRRNQHTHSSQADTPKREEGGQR